MKKESEVNNTKIYDKLVELETLVSNMSLTINTLCNKVNELENRLKSSNSEDVEFDVNKYWFDNDNNLIVNCKKTSTNSEPQIFNDFQDTLLINEEKSSNKSVKKTKNNSNSDYRWRIEEVTSSVKNIKSAISLSDRAFFIETIFRKDPALYEDNISKLNNMLNLEQAEKYLFETFPEWDLNSNAVFNFMMSIRKKLK